MLHDFLVANRAAILVRARAKATAGAASLAPSDDLQSGISLFLDQLIEALGLLHASDGEQAVSAARHGRDLLERGFTVAQVVHDYGGVCQAVTELAVENQVPITTDEFRFFNQYLDDSIAGAVTEYSRQRELSIVADGREQLGELSHELRNSLGVATLAFQSLRSGQVGLGGSTAALLGRSLLRLSHVVDSSIARVRLDAGMKATERVSLRRLVEDVAVTSSMGASSRNVDLVFQPVELGIDIEGDRQLLAAALANIVQNACTATPPEGRVLVQASATPERVIVEVADQCGGLPPGKAEELSTGPADASTGLSISRRSIAATGGQIRVRSVAGVGCIFAVDLPRLSGPPRASGDRR
jgi:signal transduction histidine kinase